MIKMMTEEDKQPTPDEKLGEKIEKYYADLSVENSSIPPDETKTHNVRDIIREANKKATDAQS